MSNFAEGRRERTYNANGVEQAFFDQRFGKTGVVAVPVLGKTIAHCCEHPRNVHSSATTREEKIVVEFVLLRRRTLQSRALDREYGGGVVRREKDMPTETIRCVFPAKREAL